MCELFGVSGSKKLEVNNYLRELASHSVDHPNGWGLAILYKDTVSIEKEPIKALKSNYFKERIRRPIEVNHLLAHIRLATKGGIEYENCHPFVKHDNSGRTWTLIHNGTIFSCDRLNNYVHIQDGQTDSERILHFIIDEIDAKQKQLSRPLNDKERFSVIDKVIHIITPNNNKVNLLIFDGELFYVHTNFKDSLYQKTVDESVLFATVPLDKEKWDNVSFNTLEAYKDGKKAFTGKKHDNEYFYNEEDMKLLYLDSSDL